MTALLNRSKIQMIYTLINDSRIIFMLSSVEHAKV